MSLRSTLGAVRRRVLCSQHRRIVGLPAGGPFVSFAFDDFPRTAYTAGGAILKDLGIRGTYYVAMGLMNTSNELGDQFRLDDLHAATADGHELGSHTFSHRSSRSVSAKTFREDVLKGQGAIRALPGLTVAGDFAYPYGEVTLAAKRIVGKEMRSCRGIFGGMNGPFVDLNLLRANSLYGDIDKLPVVDSLIQENQRLGSWLIFYTHDVRSNPSVYGCTPRLLKAAAELARKHSAKVCPVAEVLRFVNDGASMEQPTMANAY